MKPRIPKEPTWTSRTEEALRQADDFLNLVDLTARVVGHPPTPEEIHRVCSSLAHLRKNGVADSLEGDKGRLFWFFVGDDKRSRKVAERRPEDRHRKNYRPEKHEPKTRKPRA